MSNNIEVASAVHGIAPRSDELLKLGGDVERGRASQANYDELLAQEAADWLQLQTEAGITFPESGKLDWQDHLRPIVKVSDCFAPDVDNAPVTRWYNTNTFYRQPTITDKFKLNNDAAAEWAKDLGENVSLLDPSTFGSLCKNEYDGLPADRNIFQLYGELLFQLEQAGVKRVVFEDYDTNPRNLWRSSFSSIEQLGEWYQDLDFSLIYPGKQVINIPATPKRNVHVEVGNSTIQHFLRQPEYARPSLHGAEIWQQVVDADNTSPDVLEISRWPIEGLRRFGVARIVLTNSVDLERIPLPYAQDKVKRLGEFAHRFNEYLQQEEL